MKKTSIFSYIALLTGFMLVNTACEDEELSPYIEPLPGVHAFAQYSEDSPQNYIYGEEDEITLEIEWISVDNELEVNKIDLYLLFNENYTDMDNNPRVARHGGTDGIYFMTIKGGDLPANRTSTTFSVSEDDVFNLYGDATYDYVGDGEAVAVFNNTLKPSRTGGQPFIAGDNFSVRWELTTTDGLVYDSWSPSVCTELPGANCSVDWSVVCLSDLATDYTFVTTNITADVDVIPASVSGSGSWTEVANAKYELTDYSFGVFPDAYGDDPAVGSLGLLDACDDITVTGADQYGDTYTYSFSDFAGPTMTITWINTYGDGGTTVITRTDGTDWPTTLY